jgi:hypothetical protein
LQLAGQSKDCTACHLGVRVTIGRHDHPNSSSLGVELDHHVVGIRLDARDEVDVEANPQSPVARHFHFSPLTFQRVGAIIGKPGNGFANFVFVIRARD